MFGEFDVRIDPWESPYGGEVPFDPAVEEKAEDVDLGVEVPPDRWAPLSPGATPVFATVFFVDGVRRIDARILVRRGDDMAHGAFGSYAVGAVVCENGRAAFGDVHTGRVVVTASGTLFPEVVRVAPNLVYRPLAVADSDPDAPLRGIQEEMRRAEERAARELADREGSLVVADGPLTFEEPVRGAAVGMVKRLFQLYLPAEKVPLLRRLPPSSRTPLFALRSTRRFARYSWFLRLAPPQPIDSELSGLVRLEVSESVGAERARDLADATTHLLPRFVSGRARDPRSPQNLVPISALEGELRRRLGDARLLRRRIEELLLEARNSGKREERRT
ncbi:MAG: hypothetical protein KatS3mg076_2834 [Candidatus Binatia bacterium]|nr:MAG: hypothetical protein KatS3mg076_2834 [Candidatus Binatia bacterium]